MTEAIEALWFALVWSAVIGGAVLVFAGVAYLAIVFGAAWAIGKMGGGQKPKRTPRL